MNTEAKFCVSGNKKDFMLRKINNHRINSLFPKD